MKDRRGLESIIGWCEGDTSMLIKVVAIDLDLVIYIKVCLVHWNSHQSGTLKTNLSHERENQFPL